MSTPKPLPVFTGEPIVSIAAGFSALFNAVLIAFPLFGWGLEWDQMVALATIFNLALGLGTLYQRSKVTPVEKANQLIDTPLPFLLVWKHRRSDALGEVGRDRVSDHRRGRRGRGAGDGSRVMRPLLVALLIAASLLGVGAERASAHTYEVWDCTNNIIKVYGHCASPCRYPFHAWIDTRPLPSYYC